MTLTKYVISSDMTDEELDKHTIIIESGTARVERKSGIAAAAGGSDASPGIITIERERVKERMYEVDEKFIEYGGLIVALIAVGIVLIGKSLNHGSA